MRISELAVTKRPLYVNRPVLLGKEIQLWAKEQGFETTLPPEDFHITIAYSKTPVNHALAVTDDSEIEVEDDIEEERTVEQFNGGAVVLTIPSDELTDRWQYYIDEVGVVPTFPEYRAHITITYKLPDGFDLENVVPYRGCILLGPEIMEEPSDSWKDDTIEVDLADIEPDDD